MELSSSLNRDSPEPLYEQVADRINRLIDGGALLPGERIPSVRRLSRQLSVSVSTVLEAYRVLEDRRLVEARPQSGYYVTYSLADAPPKPAKTQSSQEATDLDRSELILRVRRDAERLDLLNLATIEPSPQFFPTSQLSRVLARVAHHQPEESHSYDTLAGYPPLRAQIARRALDAGCAITPDEIITTNGAQEAVVLALRAVTKPGDAVALESPTYHGFLEALEWLHLKAIEVSTCSDEGICLEALARIVRSQRVAACLLVPTFGNPLGHSMPEPLRGELVEILWRAGVPLIEDDIYGELVFSNHRPKAVKAFERDGGVLLCSSFSKTLAPGYRVGWVASGRFTERVERLKNCTLVAAATPTQMAVATLLEHGGFDRHLRRLRRTYKDLSHRMIRAIGEFFPARTLVTQPQGGHILWVELPPQVDALVLYEAALKERICIAPGPMFSASNDYDHHIRLNSGGYPWTDELRNALARLGELTARLADDRIRH